jgi:peptide/nickel transport system substrate-binding protein
MTVPAVTSVAPPDRVRRQGDDNPGVEMANSMISDNDLWRSRRAVPRAHRARWAFMGAMVAVVAVLAAACAKDAAPTSGDSSATASTLARSLDREASAGAPQSGGSMNFGLAAETDSWNPYIGQWAGSAYLVANAIFDPLAAVGSDGTVKPYLADSFTPNSDFTEWTIKLRPGISFHNGDKLDAAAVQTNLQTGENSGLTKPAFATVTAIDVVDSLTLSIKMSKPWSTFPSTLAAQPGYMAAPSQLADTLNGQSHPVGTGPFVFQSWQRDSQLDVRKNPNYWKKDNEGHSLPYLDSISYKVLTDTSSRGSALDGGSIDAMEIATPETILKYQDKAKAGEIQMITTANTQNDTTIIALNTTKPPFDDPLARQAIIAGLNQQDLAETSYSNAFPPAFGPFPENSPAYLNRADAGYPAYDPAKAKELVQQYADAHGGEQLTFDALIPPDPQYSAIAQALQQQGQAAGMKINLVSIEQTQLITKVLTGDYQASGFVLYGSPTFDRAYVFIATQPSPGLSLNFTRNFDQQETDAMDEARATSDPAKQAEAWKKVEKRMGADLDKVFLVQNVSAIAYRNNVYGFLTNKFPGTDATAVAPSLGTPFPTAVWKDQKAS